MLRLEEMVRQSVPEATTLITSGGGGGNNWRRRRRRQHTAARSTSCSCRATSATRTNDEIAQDLRRQLAGLPGVIVRANPAGGNFQLNRLLGGGGGQTAAGSSLEIRGHDLDDAQPHRAGGARRDGRHARHRRRAASAAKKAGRRSPIRVDRPKAAMLGMTRARRRQHDPDQRRRAPRPRSTASAATSTRSSSGCARPTAKSIADVGDVLVSTPSGQVVPGAQPAGGRAARPARCRSSARTWSASPASTPRSRSPLSEAVDGRPGAARPGARAARLLRRLRRRGRGTGAVVPAAAAGADPGRPAGLRGDGVAVRVAARPVHHHVLDSGRRHRRRARACC